MIKNRSGSIDRKHTGFTFLFALAVLAFVVLGCGGAKGKPVPDAFKGSWSSSDGTTFTISADSTVVYRSGATKIDNGAAEFDDATKLLKFSLLGVSLKEYKVDQMPANGKMKLDGVVFQSAGTPPVDGDSTPKTSGSTDPDMPSETDLDAMVNTAIQDFADAVEQGDFTDFRNKCSKDFKNSVTVERFNKTFEEFIKQKDELVPVLNSTATMTPDYSPAPNFTESTKKLLNLKGSFDTKQRTSFELQYVKDDGDWKLFMIRVRVDPA